MRLRVETAEDGVAPAPDEVAAIVAALHHFAAPPSESADPAGTRWRRAGRAYDDGALR